MEDDLLPVNTQSGEHYVWGDVCDGWHLLKHDDMSVIEEMVPPGAGERRHVHARARQFFYVLDGEATLEISGRSFSFSTGQGMHVPPGVEHRFRNQSTGPVRFLVMSAPTTRGDRINST